MAEWWTIEVLDSELPAELWRGAYGATIVRLAVEHGVVDWSWQSTRSGVVLELLFGDDSVVARNGWGAFRDVPAVRAALDAVPDPVNGLLMYRGLGGSSGSPVPRRPRPRIGAGALELPEPEPDPFHDLVADLTPPRNPAAAPEIAPTF